MSDDEISEALIRLQARLHMEWLSGQVIADDAATPAGHRAAIDQQVADIRRQLDAVRIARMRMHGVAAKESH